MFCRNYEGLPTYSNPLSMGMDIGSWAAKVDSPQSSTIVALPTTRLPRSPALLPLLPPNMFQARDGLSPMEQSYKVSTPHLLFFFFCYDIFSLIARNFGFPLLRRYTGSRTEKRWPMFVKSIALFEGNLNPYSYIITNMLNTQTIVRRALRRYRNNWTIYYWTSTNISATPWMH